MNVLKEDPYAWVDTFIGDDLFGSIARLKKLSLEERISKHKSVLAWREGLKDMTTGITYAKQRPVLPDEVIYTWKLNGQ